MNVRCSYELSSSWLGVSQKGSPERCRFRFFPFFFRFLPFFSVFFLVFFPFSSVFSVFFRLFRFIFRKNGEIPFARPLLRNPDWRPGLLLMKTYRPKILLPPHLFPPSPLFLPPPFLLSFFLPLLGPPLPPLFFCRNCEAADLLEPPKARKS